MYITGTFEYSDFLELAISDLEKYGILRERIVAIPLDKRVEKRRIIDSIHRADGISQIDGAFVAGAIFMELGVVYGYVWRLGPILWGLIGLGFGMVLGLLLDYLVGRLITTGSRAKDLKRNASGNKAPGVVLIVHCEESQSQMATEILWDNLALGVGQLKTP